MSEENLKTVQYTHVVSDRFSQAQLNLWLADGWKVVHVATYDDREMLHSTQSGPNNQTLPASGRQGAIVVIEAEMTAKEAEDRSKTKLKEFNAVYGKG